MNNSQALKMPQSFVAKNKLSFGSQNMQDKTSEKNDPLLSYPLRLCAYTNEVGAALSPIPGIGAKLFAASWVPALLYFGADIYDKYAKGHDHDYSTPSGRKAFNQTVFQALASVLLPTGAVILGQNVASKLYAHFSKDKMDIRAKEEILKALKRDINQDKLRIYKKQIGEILENSKTEPLSDIKNSEQIKAIKNTISNNIYSEIKTESQTIAQHKKNSGIFKRVIELFSHSKEECSHLSKIKGDKFDVVVKPYIEKMVSELVDTRVGLQRTINADATINEFAKDVDAKLIKKVTKLIDKNKNNKDVVNKAGYVVKEIVLSKLNASAMKLSLPKIVGGFIALFLLAKPIDHFVEKYIVGKVLEKKKAEPFEEKIV